MFVLRSSRKEAKCRVLTVSLSDAIDIVSHFILQLRVQHFDLIQYIVGGRRLVGVVPSFTRGLFCVVFPDEIDCLFGVCMLSRETRGAPAHRGVITKPMYEMDVPCSGSWDRYFCCCCPGGHDVALENHRGIEQ